MTRIVNDSITFHVAVRFFTIKDRQKAVALQVAGPVVRVYGEKINKYLFLYVFKWNCNFMFAAFQIFVANHSHRSSSRK